MRPAVFVGPTTPVEYSVHTSATYLYYRVHSRVFCQQNHGQHAFFFLLRQKSSISRVLDPLLNRTEQDSLRTTKTDFRGRLGALLTKE